VRHDGQSALPLTKQQEKEPEAPGPGSATDESTLSEAASDALQLQRVIRLDGYPYDFPIDAARCFRDV